MNALTGLALVVLPVAVAMAWFARVDRSWVGVCRACCRSTSRPDGPGPKCAACLLPVDHD